MPDTPLEVTPHEAADRSTNTVLVDVRELDEWSAGHAPHALHVSLGNLAVDAIPAGSRVMVICRSGRRSHDAATVLCRAGINAANVTGGMNAWAAAGLPIVRDDGTSGNVI